MRLRTTSAIFGALALALAGGSAQALTAPKASDPIVSDSAVVPVYGGYGYRHYGYRSYYRPYRYGYYGYRRYRPYYGYSHYGYRRSWW